MHFMDATSEALQKANEDLEMIFSSNYYILTKM